jgi:hypothetical protein
MVEGRKIAPGKISAPDGFCRGEGGTPPGAGATTLMAASAWTTGLWLVGSGRCCGFEIFCIRRLCLFLAFVDSKSARLRVLQPGGYGFVG